MKLPPLLYVLGYAGLLPFVVGPLWLSIAPASAPLWLDRAWLLYAALIAAFMAGSFWGLALIVIENPAGQWGLLLSAAFMLLSWFSVLLPFPLSLAALTAVFVMLAAAEIWRERVLDRSNSYFRLRMVLTIGVLACVVWRYLLG
jgi:hypothetical protein